MLPPTSVEREMRDESQRLFVPISQARASVLRAGADAVGRYTVDLIKKQRSRSGMLEISL